MVSAETTRRSLHAVAEWVIAGPQFRRHGTIRLRVVPGGFAGVASPLMVRAGSLVWDGGVTPIHGRTCGELAEEVDTEPFRPDQLYHDGCGIGPDQRLEVDDDVADALLAWFAAGDVALRSFAPDQQPVLWPEHFDLAVTVDHGWTGQVNYGVSPGDAGHAEPYAYVGPWDRRTGHFWNAPFGALRPQSELPDATAIGNFYRAAAKHL
jgi:hypothetical protein